MDEFAVSITTSQSAGLGKQRRDPGDNLRRGGDLDVVFGEVDAGFEQGDQCQQLLFQRCETARDGPIDLLGRDAGLIERGGLDQVMHGLGAGQVQAAIQKGAQRKLPGICQPRTSGEQPIEPGAENDRCAVAGDLHDIFLRIGARRGVVSHHHLVNHRLLCVDQFRQKSSPWFPVGRTGETQYARGDGARFDAAEAQDADAAPAGWRRDGGDGIVQAHRLPPW